MSACRLGAAMAALFLLGASALAASVEWGWTAGEPAQGASRVLAGPGIEVPLDLPKDFVKVLPPSSVLVYFAPSCPHCRAVAKELEALDQWMATHLGGATRIVWVASGNQSAIAADEFRQEFGITGQMVHDANGNIAAAAGWRSTPAAVLVLNGKKGPVAVDGWIPFRPGLSTLVRMRLAADPWAELAPGVYQGNNTCGGCHVDEMASWRLSLHSVAWRTLQEGGDDADPKCVGCHVTGAGQPTGWVAGDEALVDVGCEACHGPGGPHDGAPDEALASCVGCHDKEHSIVFRHDKAVPLIDHYAATTLDEAAYSERRKALFRGEVPQELIAFPEGDTVGQGACAACHPSEVQAWSASAHGVAMRRLPGDAAADAGCVKCHATAKKVGVPPAAEVSAYHVAESVGCESCHGPGGAHVAAGGGTDNIVHLGESCPVCVLEALCTSCHTKDWDPDWALEPGLEAVRAHHGK